jgi:hypothetical protein
LTTTRRQFLSAALLALTPKSERPITGSFVNEDFRQGHLLRDRAVFPKPVKALKIPLVIVGAGVAGLSAAWRLDKHGFHDFLVLELAQQAGGNARWGENEVTAYPWGAHYVPIPDKSTVLVRELFEELGVLHDGQWEERDLCYSPKERLFLHGRWQEDIEPAIGLSYRDRDQFRRFADRIDHFRRSGEFTIPMALGAKPSQLDRLSMADWMSQQGFDSTYLNWYINYACRDDYGTLASDTSAWAGIHYFASRQPEEKGPITWPEGNGWIIKKLLSKLDRFVRTSSTVNHISQVGRGLRVCAGESEYLADVVIFAAPTFLAPYVIEGFPPVPDFVYSPWLTANLTLEHLPRETGIELAWDNVNYDSPALGYVVATHQSLRTFVDRSVWTFYWSLAQGTPSRNRRLLLEKDWSYWKEVILNDLARIHPDIRSCVSRIDIMRMGHAMARPSVGTIFAEERRRLAKPSGRLLFANSDLSGFSIFEEAQYHGVKAAEHALRMLGSR